jgi:hypothetical protein
MTTWVKDHRGNKCSAESSDERLALAFAIEPFHRNIPEELLFQNLADMWTALGRQPKFRDCYPGLSRYSAHTYAYRFGTWRDALGKFIEWTQNNGALPIAAPAVRSHRTPRQVNLRLRAEILMRDFSTCQLCGAQPKDGAQLEVDHIVAWANGGETVPENLQTLCTVCNKGKSDSSFYDGNESA